MVAFLSGTSYGALLCLLCLSNLANWFTLTCGCALGLALAYGFRNQLKIRYPTDEEIFRSALKVQDGATKLRAGKSLCKQCGQPVSSDDRGAR